MTASQALRIGVDLGGTKIEAIALSATGEVVARLRAATPRGDYEATLAAVADLVRRIEAMAARHGAVAGSVGVGIPGALSRRDGRIKNANSTWLNGRAFDRDLVRALGRPVRLANDANCFALSEASDGAAAGASPVFGVILGTGVGGGIVVDGRVVTGRNAIAGEWGHNPLPWPSDEERPGPPCYCGKSGCIETFLSGPGLVRDQSGDRRLDSPAEVAAAAADGAPDAIAVLARYQDRLARSLAQVINIVDPEVIVLGGGLSNLAALYREVPARLPAYVFSDRVDTRIVPPRHGDSSGVRGAAWLWPAGEDATP